MVFLLTYSANILVNFVRLIMISLPSTLTNTREKKWLSIFLKSVLELIAELEKKMLSAAKDLNFEKAAELRDRIKRLREKDLKIIL